MKGAAFNRGKSRQDYPTPREFIVAFKEKWGTIGVDLAATAENAVCERFVSPEQDTWETDWAQFADWTCPWAWLNPEHEDSDKASEKMLRTLRECQTFRGALFVPGSIDSAWWREHVHGKCLEVICYPRVPFDGANGYPKAMVLCLYGRDAGRTYWNWEDNVPPEMLRDMKARMLVERKRLWAIAHPDLAAEKEAKRAGREVQRELKRQAKEQARIERLARKQATKATQEAPCNS